MIISHRHHFIFIKTHKTAGTSIEGFLSPFCGEEDILTPLHPPLPEHLPRNYRGFFNPLGDLGKGHGWPDWARTVKHFILAERYYNHMPARLVKLRLGASVFDNYYKFCVERNPWEKTLSYFYMAKHRAKGQLSLEEFIQQGRFPVDRTLYTDEAGQLLVDRVVRYEHLADDLGEVFAHLGIPFEGELGVKAKSGYRSDRRSYRDVFTPEQQQIIADAFAWEIESFGYRF